MEFYKKSNGKWVIGHYTGVPSGTCSEHTDPTTDKIMIRGNGIVYASDKLPTDFTNANGDNYADLTAYENATKDFFYDATLEVANQLNIRVTKLESKLPVVLYLDYWVQELPSALNLESGLYAFTHAVGNELQATGIFVTSPDDDEPLNCEWIELVDYLSGDSSKNEVFINRNDSKQYSWSGSIMVALTVPLNFASQSDAETGTDNSKVMTALRVIQSIVYQLIHLDFAGLSTTSKKIIGSINELLSNKAEKTDVRIYRGDSTGTANTIAVTVTPTFTTLTDKDIFYVKVLYANSTTTPTLAISGGAAKTIVKKSGNALAIGDIQVGYYKFVYDGNIDKFHLMTPSMEDVNFATMLHSASLKSSVVDGDETAGNDSANSYGLTRWTWSTVWNYMINKPIRTTAISAYDIDLSTGEDFSKTCGASSAFTISNPIIKKKFRLFLTGGTLAVPTFTGYTTTWMASTAVTDYVPANVNVLYCEIRSAGTLNLFWGE